MYFSILNLPLCERFKAHNIILIGMIPGLNEPSNLNPFLAPLVSDLNRLFTGVYVQQQGSSLPIRLRAMIACIVCDLPATRKLCGMNHVKVFSIQIFQYFRQILPAICTLVLFIVK